MGNVEVFVAVNPGTFPMPGPVMPIAGLVFVQSKVVPTVGLVKLVAAIAVLLQTVSFTGTATVGLGFTVTMIF